MPTTPERDELLTLYRVAIDEYRFEVKLNTDRMMHYIIFNSAILTVATGLLKIEAGSWLNLFVALVFTLGGCTSRLGTRSIRKGHEYDERTIYKKTLLEELLGLTKTVKDYPRPRLRSARRLDKQQSMRFSGIPTLGLPQQHPNRGASRKPPSPSFASFFSRTSSVASRRSTS